ncbi:MAG: Gfo/Idh/MocA family oxidoreductase [Armatimonadetes bacterium]|nr:Gfo/Idh/MocA family oxidoreductase [Armatimonadota bacterium]
MKGIIVGLGGWGSSWSRVIRDSGWEIAAWVDVNPAALEHAVRDLGAEPRLCYSALDEALGKVKADAAFIFTPPNAGRAKDIIAAMDAGLHVLADKPLTTSPDEMTAILEAHRQSNVKLMIGQNYRWYPGSELMRQTIATGELGRLGYMNVYYHMAENMRGHHMAEMPHGLVLGMCVHHLDMMRFVIGAEPETILAKTWNPPWSWTKADACAECVMTFPGSVTVNYFAGFAAHHSGTDWYGRWHLEFERGALLTDGVKSSIIRDGQQTEINGPEIDSMYTRNGVLREFTSAIEEDRTPECSVEDNAKSLRIAFSIIESARRHEEIGFTL